MSPNPTSHPANDRATVAGDPPFAFTNADQFTEWLERYVQLPNFRNSLTDLRALADEPVDARLERANGMATLVEVSPERQAAFDQQPVGGELEFELELEEGEPQPQVEQLRWLNSAGVRFELVPNTASVDGRAVRFRAIKLG